MVTPNFKRKHQHSASSDTLTSGSIESINKIDLRSNEKVNHRCNVYSNYNSIKTIGSIVLNTCPTFIKTAVRRSRQEFIFYRKNPKPFCKKWK